jgi:hypothetical protein
MENGWIKTYRKIVYNPIFKDEHLLQLWMYILLSVNHKKTKIIFNKKEIVLMPGSGVFGLNQIVSDLKNLNNPKNSKFKKYKTIYYRKLKILEKLGNVKLQTTSKFTIISVVKWGEYQQDETQVKLKWNSSETQVKTNKNEKKEKKEKKEKHKADSSESATPATPKFYLTKTGKKLTGKRLDFFEEFWEIFNYKKGKSAAADSWYKIAELNSDLINKIFTAAKIEAGNRERNMQKGQSPKWAQGWLTERRWEDEGLQQEQPPEESLVFEVDPDDR